MLHFFVLIVCVANFVHLYVDISIMMFKKGLCHSSVKSCKMNRQGTKVVLTSTMMLHIEKSNINTCINRRNMSPLEALS